MQGRNGDPDAGQSCGHGGRVGWLGDGNWHKYATIVKQLVGSCDASEGSTPVLRDDPQGAMRQRSQRGDLRVHTTDALPCAAETNNIVKETTLQFKKRMQHCVRVVLIQGGDYVWLLIT